MFLQRIALGSFVLLSFSVQMFAAGNESATGPAADTPELKALDRFRGVWKGTVRTPDGNETAGQSTSKWILDGRYLQTEWTAANSKGMILRGYDERDKKYHTWSFQSRGGLDALESTGVWDETAKTLTTTGAMADGRGSITVTAKFPDDDTEEFIMTIKVPDNPTLIQISGTNKRQAK